MKVALIKCPWWVMYCPPYILSFFSTLLRNNGHETFCFDLNNLMYHKSGPEYKKYWEDRDFYSIWENKAFIAKLSKELKLKKYRDEILATGSKVLCFDTHTPSVLISLELAKMIKVKDKSRIIIFMGNKD